MVTIDETNRLQSIHSTWLTNLYLAEQLLCQSFDVPWNLKRGESTHPLVLPKPLHEIDLVV